MNLQNISRIFPDWSEIDKLQQPLTEGERYLAEYLDKYLSSDWEIFIQPYMNNCRPDIVIFNPKKGAGIFEVKDWNLNNYKVTENFDPNNDRLKNYHFYLKKTNKEISSPISQTNNYIKKLSKLYTPFLPSKFTNYEIKQMFHGFIYFHKSTQEETNKFMPKNHYTKFLGNDSLEDEKIFSIINKFKLDLSGSNEEWASYVRFWLQPPYHSKSEGYSYNLSIRQKNILNTNFEKHPNLNLRKSSHHMYW